MVQPYPHSDRIPEATRPPIPASVRTATTIMYAGAAASVIAMIVDIATINATRNAFARHFPDLTTQQLTAQQIPLTVGWIIGGLLGATLWIVIARACRAGKNWGRVTGTVAFGVATVEVPGNLAVPEATAARIFFLLIWLIGLVAVIYLWRGDSRAFFTAHQS
jgi:hypothetical protein